jgi:carbon storage regulator CsrA
MLVLTRKVGESILIPSQGLTIQIGPVKRGRVRLRITAPAETRIVREEVLEHSGHMPAGMSNDPDRLLE